MILKCVDFSQIEKCKIVFDGEENFVCSQMVGHLKGSHSISISQDDILKTVSKKDVKKLEKANMVEVRSFPSVAKRLFGGRSRLRGRPRKNKS